MKVHCTTYVRARAATEVAPGIFQIEIPCEEISNEDRITVRRLFPNTQDAAYDLLNREMVLSSIVPAEEAHAAIAKKSDWASSDDSLPSDWPGKKIKK